MPRTYTPEPFKASYAGRCVRCCIRWRAGTRIIRSSTPKGWAHAKCPGPQVRTSEIQCYDCLELIPYCKCPSRRKR